MKKITNSILTSILSILLSIFIITTAILIILNFKPLYYSFIEKNEIQNFYQLTNEEIKRNYDVLIHYLGSFSETELNFPFLPSSTYGLIHFKEVKDIFQLITKLCLTSLPTFFLLLLLFKKQIKQPSYIKGAALINLGIISFLSLLIIVDFSRIFVLFHKIAFRNDFWIFDYEKDPIILYLPETFFMYSALSIAFLIISISLLLLFLSKKRNKKHTPDK